MIELGSTYMLTVQLFILMNNKPFPPSHSLISVVVSEIKNFLQTGLILTGVSHRTNEMLLKKTCRWLDKPSDKIILYGSSYTNDQFKLLHQTQCFDTLINIPDPRPLSKIEAA